MNLGQLLHQLESVYGDKEITYLVLLSCIILAHQISRNQELAIQLSRFINVYKFES